RFEGEPALKELPPRWSARVASGPYSPWQHRLNENTNGCDMSQFKTKHLRTATQFYSHTCDRNIFYPLGTKAAIISSGRDRRTWCHLAACFWPTRTCRPGSSIGRP